VKRRAPTAKKKIRILIADKEGIFRLGLKKLFALEDDLRVVAQADNAAQLLALAKAFQPNVLYVQAEILAGQRDDLIAKVKSTAPRSKLIVTASAMSDQEALQYVTAGASGVILKSVPPALFVKSARKVMDNEVWLPKKQVAEMARLLESAQERPLRPVDTLTQREKSIISYLMLGWRNREIARQLNITEQTVKNHLRTIYDKVGVSDRLELVLYAIHQNLDLPPVTPHVTAV